jgi:signal transduction histidine kinase/ligand-binding sensor domain-containing protein
MRRVLAAGIVAVLPAAAALALDPTRAPSQYVVRTWPATSLKSNTVHAVLQDRAGDLWLGTSAGAVRYDGSRFRLFGASTTPEFGDGGVSALAQDASGTLYLGTTSGAVFQRTGQVWKRLFAPSRPGIVRSLCAARDGSVWAAFDDQPPTRWKDGRAEAFLAQAQTLTPQVIAEAADGAIWIGTRDGLLRAQGEVFTRQEISDTVQALWWSASGVLWIGTPHGLYRMENGHARRYTEGDGLAKDHVSAILEDHHGNLWVGTAGGLSRLAGDHFQSLRFAQGLADDDVRALFEDRQGTLWVGTGNGLSSISEGPFVAYGRAEGLPDDKVTAVIPSRDGSTWVGTLSGSVSRLREGHLETITLPGGIGRQGIVTLYESGDGALWIATENGRLFRVSGGQVVERTPPGAAGRQRVTRLFEDKEGLVLFVTGPDVGRGLVHLIGGRYVAFPGKPPHLGFVHSAQREGTGPIWLASTQGLGSLRGLELRRFQDGLPERRVRSISFDPEGGMWLATAGGLAHFRDGEIQALTVGQGLPENYLRVVLDDGLGHLWAAGMGTLFRLDIAEVRDVLAGRAPRVRPILFDTSDGLRTTEAPLGNDPGFRGPDGRLWFATAKGAAVIDPRGVHEDEPALAPRIEGVLVDGHADAAAGGLRSFPPGRGELAVEYTGAGLSDRTRFRYRLDGFDADWVDGEGRGRAYYSSLPAGRYRFRVAASNRYGRWTGPETAFDFTLAPPFYRRPVFYAGVAALLAMIALGAHRLRVRQMQARFDAVLGERTRIARELHDTLAQGVAGIPLQIETGLDYMATRPEAAREHFELATAMAREGLAEVRRSIWVLRAQTSKGRDGLGASLDESLRLLTAGSPLRPAVEITGEARPLPPMLEHNLLRITHEVVLNAVRHSGAATLRVGLHYEEDAVHLVVKDDGRGFDAGAALALSGGEHFGLIGMTERARALGGKLELRSRPGEGTEVDCRLPYVAPEVSP